MVIGARGAPPPSSSARTSLSLSLSLSLPPLPIHTHRRQVLLRQGIVDVSAASITHTLTRRGPGASIMVIVGGAKESLHARPGTNTLVLAARKGPSSSGGSVARRSEERTMLAARNGSVSVGVLPVGAKEKDVGRRRKKRNKEE